MYYILDKNNEPVRLSGSEEDRKSHAKWLLDIDRRTVARDKIMFPNNILVTISTIFTALDYSLPGSGSRPLLFETMVFIGHDSDPESVERYPTWQHAEKGHKKMYKYITDPAWLTNLETKLPAKPSSKLFAFLRDSILERISDLN